MTLSLGALQKNEEVSVALQIVSESRTVVANIFDPRLHNLDGRVGHCMPRVLYRLKVSQDPQASSSDTNLHFQFYLSTR